MKGSTVPNLADQIRGVVAARGLSAYALAKATGLDRTSVRRFLAGADATLAVASLYCAALSLRLIEGRSRSRPAPRPRSDAGLVDLTGDDR